MFQSRTLIITIVTATTTIISGGTARSPPRYGRAAQTSGSAREFEPFHQTDKKVRSLEFIPVSVHENHFEDILTLFWLFFLR